MLRTVNYCKMLSDDNPIKTMPIHVFRCFLLFVSFLFVPGICRNRCLLSYAKYRNIFANTFLQLNETKQQVICLTHMQECTMALWHYELFPSFEHSPRQTSCFTKYQYWPIDNKRNKARQIIFLWAPCFRKLFCSIKRNAGSQLTREILPAWYRAWRVIHTLRKALNACVLAKVGTVLGKVPIISVFRRP